MPLVKNGKIASRCVRPCRGRCRTARRRRDPDFGGAVSRRSRRRCRAGPASTGVIWPNNRDVDDLVPYLDRLAVVALVFPSFRDGRAYSQARLLRERHGYRGELRATGQVLRDQFVFMLRAGLRRFRGEEGKRRGSVRQHRQALFGVLSADRRWPDHRACTGGCSCAIRRAPASERVLLSRYRRSDSACAGFAGGRRRSIARFATQRQRR